MDVAFEFSAWHPTKISEPNDHSLTEQEVIALSAKLSSDAKHLQRHPYDPHNWLERGHTLDRLLYPELAAGDLYKARLLCDSLLEHNGTRDSRWRLGWRMGFWMRDEDAISCGALQTESTHAELVGELRHQEGLQQRIQALKTRIEYAEVEHYHDHETRGTDGGKVRRRPYPWMSERHRHRSDELIELANIAFVNCAARFGCRPTCQLRRHAFGRCDADETETSDILGVFALRDISQGALVLVDETEVFGCNGPGVRGDLDNLHGGRGCSDPIHPNLPDDDAAHELRWIRDELGTEAAPTLLLVRLLLLTIRDGVSHPLDHDMAARLTPNYARTGHRCFSRAQDLAVPLTALAQFGRDIFADPACEAWVLFELLARLDNNSWASPAAYGVHPLFSMFNHSCEPNVRWQAQAAVDSDMDHRLLHIHALRDIAADEQLFVEYNSYAGDKDLLARREDLRYWLDEPCQCSRCLREEKEAIATAEAAQDESLPNLSESALSAWDVDERPVFPEDRT